MREVRVSNASVHVSDASRIVATGIRSVDIEFLCRRLEIMEGVAEATRRIHVIAMQIAKSVRL